MRKTLLVLVVAFVASAFSPSASAHVVACCKPDGSCFDKLPDECLFFGGEPIEGKLCADDPCEELLECRVTGGANGEFEDWNGDFTAKCATVNGTDRYHGSGQAGAPSSPFGEWTHQQRSGPSGKFVFHAGTSSAPPGTVVEVVTCSDPGFCNPARPAPAKQIDFAGVGAFNNLHKHNDICNAVSGVSLHAFSVHIEDLGEPGKNGLVEAPGPQCPAEGNAGGEADCDCPDFYRITIHETEDAGSPVCYEVFGYISTGNLQIHPPVGESI